VDLDDLLSKTSRTFALAIPLLPEPTQLAVGVAYLLFRVADTFEDATLWVRPKRIEALERLVEVLNTEPVHRLQAAQSLTQWCLKSPPLTHMGYLELLTQLPQVLERVQTMAPLVRDIILRHTVRTAEGMARVVSRADEDGSLQLTSMVDLKEYCYLVAGIVGELLTELFLHDCAGLRHVASSLRRSMVAFGEGLQLVNILKDAGADAHDGRVYLPPGVPRADIFALARRDLEQAQAYVQALQQGGAPRGYVAFTGLSSALAFKALEALESEGPGAKVPREEVARVFASLGRSLDLGHVFDARAL
jgi:farnesyl-diphosphate farnesyltransferase